REWRTIKSTRILTLVGSTIVDRLPASADKPVTRPSLLDNVSQSAETANDGSGGRLLVLRLWVAGLTVARQSQKKRLLGASLITTSTTMVPLDAPVRPILWQPRTEKARHISPKNLLTELFDSESSDPPVPIHPPTVTRNVLFRMDLENWHVVHEWKVHEDIPNKRPATTAEDDDDDNDDVDTQPGKAYITGITQYILHSPSWFTLLLNVLKVKTANAGGAKTEKLMPYTRENAESKAVALEYRAQVKEAYERYLLWDGRAKESPTEEDLEEELRAEHERVVTAAAAATANATVAVVEAVLAEGKQG
ncbi:hypothetical protein CONLIGDRAFT_692370, partial [Coniochaeta ligniaria NRRL 30616]